MTSHGGRLYKLYTKLTARERVLAVLAAVQEDREPDPVIFATMPPGQGAAYRRDTEQLETLDTKGRAWLLAIDRAVRELEVLGGWIATFLLVQIRLEPLREVLWETRETRDAGRTSTLAPPLRARVEKALAGFEVFAIGDHDLDPANTEAKSMPAMLVQRLCSGVQQQWRELRVIDDEARAVAEDLGCDDALAPDLRATLQRCHERLETLAHDTFGLTAPIELPEPDAELREAAAKVFGRD